MAGQDLILFYGWWQSIVCAFAFVGLLGIWYHIGRKQNDFGQVYLALSVLCWSFSGIVAIIYSNQITDPNSKLYYDGLTSILSLFNSLFILLALPWFRYIPEKIKPLVKSKHWLLIVGLPFIFSLLPTISTLLQHNISGMISELDVYYSILTLVFLGLVLWQSFAKRRLHFLAWMSLVCILITFGAQVLKLSGVSINLILCSAIFKTCLIMMFFALALSWVKELAENVIPQKNLISIQFNRHKSSSGKMINAIEFLGFPGHQTRMVEMTPTSFDLMHKFAKRRKSQNNEWLEIKPKSADKTVDYDINDHNQIKRILHVILDSLYGKNNWTKEIHETPLRESLFEMSQKRERKIRLAILPENISLVKS